MSHAMMPDVNPFAIPSTNQARAVRSQNTKEYQNTVHHLHCTMLLLYSRALLAFFLCTKTIYVTNIQYTPYITHGTINKSVRSHIMSHVMILAHSTLQYELSHSLIDSIGVVSSLFIFLIKKTAIPRVAMIPINVSR